MNWKKLIQELSEAGVTQVEMAKHCDCGQSTISEISRGLIKNPAYGIGVKLVELHKSKVLNQDQTAEAA
ncbi:MAG: helix-turn-helix domain-containing protein [Methylobacillus glycogenes]|nr:helix-turn-helix domain-containing protein [Methylobacillus glycogenes]